MKYINSNVFLGGPAVIQFTGAVPRVDIANEGSKYHD